MKVGSCMYGEDLELENVERIERQLIQNFGELSASLTSSIKTIKDNLQKYLIMEAHLNRINEEMYLAGQLEDIKEAEAMIKHLAQTFWE